MTITVHHRVDRPDLGLGLVRVEGVEVSAQAPTALGLELDRWVKVRRERPLSPEEDRVRQGCREVLRNGRYRATGRGKPASEYLLRAAEGSFPRISGPVDANNLVSLIHCVPISVWDLELCPGREFELRLGRAGERYVFNTAGQELELEDLVCGCARLPDGGSTPLVTPIKDSMASKIRPSSRSLAGCIYYPLGVGTAEQLEVVTGELLKWLLTCGARVRGQLQLCPPGHTVSL